MGLNLGNLFGTAAAMGNAYQGGQRASETLVRYQDPAR